MKHSKKPGSFFVALVLLAFGLAAASPAPAANHNTLTTVIVVDLSGSMAGAKLQYLKEAGKLSAVFLDGTVLLVPFSTSATLDSTTVLSDWPSRVQLMKRFDGLPLGGGTDYLAALRKVLSLNLPRDSRVIFISDGANGNGTDEMVLDLVRQLPGPVHTISIAAGAKAEPLLQAMALRNNGSATRVEQPQQLVEALVALAQRSSEYAAYSPSEVIKQFKGTFSGTVIAIGFNANVRVSGVPEITGPISEHIGNLSERIFVKRLDLGQQTDLTLEAIQQLSPNGRIAKILRNDFNPFGPPRPEHTMAVGVKTDVTVAGNPSPDPNQPNPPPTLQIKNKNTGQIEDSQVAVKGVTPGTWTAGLTPTSVGPKEIIATSEPRPGFTFSQIIEANVEKPVAMGLAFAPQQPMRDCGTFSANAGRVNLGTFSIPTQDDNPISYMAEITHLGGQNTFITTTVSPPEIAPTRVMPASMTLFADIANVPAGEYMGMIDLRPTVIPGSWKLPFKITVGEPLSATLHLLSGLAPGRVTRGILTIRNSGGAVDNVRLECPGFSLPQGKVEIYDLPPRVSLPAKDDKIIAIRVAADPRIPAVATATGELLIYRTDIPNRVPVSLKLSSGESESVLAVSPASISLNGAPGSEAVFDLVVRAASAAVLPDQIDSVELSGARTATGQPVTIAAGFVTPQKKPIAKARLVPGEDLLMKGHVLLPAKAGIYRAAVKVESGQNGSREIAVQITVN